MITEATRRGRNTR